MEKQIGLYLKKARNKRNLTQEQASYLIGISRSYFSDIETGRYFPSLRLLNKLNHEFQLFYLIPNDGNAIQKQEIS